MVDVYVNGIAQERNVDVNVSGANIKVEQLQDESMFQMTRVGDRNSSIHFDSLNSTLNVDANGTATTNLSLSKDVKIAIANTGKVKPTIDGALLPKDELPIGTKVEINDEKIKFTVPMAEKIEF